MKSAVALMVALALVFGSGALCAATAQAPVQTVSMECGDMPGSDDRPHRHDTPDVARACHSCIFPAPAIGTNLNATGWHWISPKVRAPQSLSGLTLEPPTPPPRQVVPRSVSILSGEYT